MHQVLRTVPRQIVNHIFRAGLAAAHGHGCVATWLEEHPLSGPVHLVAIGKAACAMSMGANRILHEQIIRSLIITKTGHLDAVLVQDTRFRCIESGHPLPNSDSLLAGSELCRFLEDAPPDAEFLFLISGGASSLVEVLRDGMNLDDLLRVNRWLLGSGLDIAAINRVRQALSRLKGGGLLAFLHDRKATVLLVSDVAGDDPAIIGSGLLLPGILYLTKMSTSRTGWCPCLPGPGHRHGYRKMFVTISWLRSILHWRQPPATAGSRACLLP